MPSRKTDEALAMENAWLLGPLGHGHPDQFWAVAQPQPGRVAPPGSDTVQ